MKKLHARILLGLLCSLKILNIMTSAKMNPVTAIALENNAPRIHSKEDRIQSHRFVIFSNMPGLD
jgi:hypothetical protein